MALGLALWESLHKFRGYRGRGDGNLCSSWHFIILTALSRAHLGLGASKRAPGFCLSLSLALSLSLSLSLSLLLSFPKEKRAFQVALLLLLPSRKTIFLYNFQGRVLDEPRGDDRTQSSSLSSFVASCIYN